MIALAAVNTDRVMLDWLFGETETSLWVVIVASALLELAFEVEVPTEMGGNYGLFGYFQNVLVLDTFYPAEDYHQEYFANNPDQGYCRVVIAPKLNKLGLENAETY